MDDEAKRRRLAEAAEKAQLIRQRKGSVSPRMLDPAVSPRPQPSPRMDAGAVEELLKGPSDGRAAAGLDDSDADDDKRQRLADAADKAQQIRANRVRRDSKPPELQPFAASPPPPTTWAPASPVPGALAVAPVSPRATTAAEKAQQIKAERARRGTNAPEMQPALAGSLDVTPPVSPREAGDTAERVQQVRERQRTRGGTLARAALPVVDDSNARRRDEMAARLAAEEAERAERAARLAAEEAERAAHDAAMRAQLTTPEEEELDALLAARTAARAAGPGDGGGAPLSRAAQAVARAKALAANAKRVASAVSVAPSSPAPTPIAVKTTTPLTTKVPSPSPPRVAPPVVGSPPVTVGSPANSNSAGSPRGTAAAAAPAAKASPRVPAVPPPARLRGKTTTTAAKRDDGTTPVLSRVSATLSRASGAGPKSPLLPRAADVFAGAEQTAPTMPTPTPQPQPRPEGSKSPTLPRAAAGNGALHSSGTLRAPPPRPPGLALDLRGSAAAAAVGSPQVVRKSGAPPAAGVASPALPLQRATGEGAAAVGSPALPRRTRDAPPVQMRDSGKSKLAETSAVATADTQTATLRMRKSSSAQEPERPARSSPRKSKDVSPGVSPRGSSSNGSDRRLSRAAQGSKRKSVFAPALPSRDSIKLDPQALREMLEAADAAVGAPPSPRVTTPTSAMAATKRVTSLAAPLSPGKRGAVRVSPRNSVAVSGDHSAGSILADLPPATVAHQHLAAIAEVVDGDDDDIEALLREARVMEEAMAAQAAQRTRELQEAEAELKRREESLRLAQEDEERRRLQAEEEAVFAALMAGVQGIAQQDEQSAAAEADAARARAEQEMSRLLAEAARQKEEHERLVALQQESERVAREAAERAAAEEARRQQRADEKQRKEAERARRALVSVRCGVCARVWPLSKGFCGECGSFLEGCAEVTEAEVAAAAEAEAARQDEVPVSAEEARAKKQQQAKLERQEKMARELEVIFNTLAPGMVRRTLIKHDWAMDKATEELLEVQREAERLARAEEEERRAREEEEKTPTRAKARYDYEATDPTELSLREGDVVSVIKADASGWWIGELRGVRGLFPANYCKILYADDEDSSELSYDDSLEYDSDEDDDKPSKEVVMYQVCKVCQLAQDAALLCRQCGCSLADIPMVRKDEYLRSHLLESIRLASIAKLRPVGDKSPEPVRGSGTLSLKGSGSAGGSDLAALIARKRVGQGDDDDAAEDGDWE